MTIPQLIIAAAQRHGVDPRLAVEVAVQESRLDQNAVSAAGAIGVFQLMPATAAALGVDPRNLEQNIEGGVRYLKQQLTRFGDVAQALGAYNWGPERVEAAVRSAGADWLSRAPTETRNYVQAILSRLGDWQRAPAITPESLRAGVQEFQGLSQQAQTVILLGALGLSLLYLFGAFSDD
ncbi:MAG: lytic transglycosylase domain-containing protein [Acidobacteria bacterium]|nr:lytic transglycosylase domain-containing protein [Acidobacteriota bacterium]